MLVQFTNYRRTNLINYSYRGEHLSGKESFQKLRIAKKKKPTSLEIGNASTERVHVRPIFRGSVTRRISPPRGSDVRDPPARSCCVLHRPNPSTRRCLPYRPGVSSKRAWNGPRSGPPLLPSIGGRNRFCAGRARRKDLSVEI